MMNPVKSPNGGDLEGFAANGSKRGQVFAVSVGTVWRIDSVTLGTNNVATYQYDNGQYEEAVATDGSGARVVPYGVTQLTLDAQYLVEYSGDLEILTVGTPPA